VRGGDKEELMAWWNQKLIGWLETNEFGMAICAASIIPIK